MENFPNSLIIITYHTSSSVITFELLITSFQWLLPNYYSNTLGCSNKWIHSIWEYIWGESLRGLNPWNRKATASNPTGCLSELSKPNSLQGSQLTSSRTFNQKNSNYNRVKVAVPLTAISSWPWGSHVALRKIVCWVLPIFGIVLSSAV